MGLLDDKKFHLIILLSLVSYFSFRGAKLFQNTSFVFIITFLLAYRIRNEIGKSFVLAVLVAFLLKCMLRFEKFSSTEVFKINFNDDDMVTLGEGTYDNNTIPSKIIKKMNDITSFTVDDRYYVLITKKYAQGPRSYRGTYIIQNDNPFDGFAKIEVLKVN